LKMEQIDCRDTKDRLEFIWERNPKFPFWTYDKLIREYYRFWEGATTDEQFGLIFSDLARVTEPVESITRAFRKMTNRPGTYGEKQTLEGYRAIKFKGRRDKNKRSLT